MKYFQRYDSPVGPLLLVEEDQALVNALFDSKGEAENFPLKQTPLLQKTAEQLTEYFAGQRTFFDLPLNISGTEFQKKVWQQLLSIPYGETRSYGEIAQSIKNPKASRAVGLANSRNPIVIIIPCHRVIGQSGKLVGFGGGLDAKKYLLKLEQEHA